MNNPEELFREHYKRHHGRYPDELVMARSQWIIDAMREYAIDRFIEYTEFELKQPNPLYSITMNLEYLKHLKESNAAFVSIWEKVAAERKKSK